MHLELSKDTFFTRGGILDTLLDNTFDQAIAVDKDERIIFFSKSSQLFSGLLPEQAIGKHIGEEVANHKFTEVLRTGVADKGSLLVLRDKVAIANHIPVIDKGEIIGAIGIVFFSSLSTVNKLISELSTTRSKEYFEMYNKIARRESSYTFQDFIGNSDIVKNLLANAKSAANSNYPILLIGETGTGKEILANAIHSENKHTFLQPFVKINCSAIPNNLLESELFGYEKGAFTGAFSTKIGKFEMANNGSILLDEIGEMDILLQTKLLRVLEEKEFERVGGSKLIPTNARVIALTNANLPTLCREKKFREDLYYRLNTLEIYVPPLRARMEDIPLLVEYFINSGKLNIKLKKDAIKALMQYNWPGNVRQLKNVINRFGVLKHNQVIGAEDVFAVLSQSPLNSFAAAHKTAYLLEATQISNEKAIASPQSLENIEKTAIERVLQDCNYNQVAAAKTLKIARTTLIRKIKKYNIQASL
ncbi:MAG: sigma-54-dependent Fis family transcriptional regulator [Firmicutes bacterium]|nr:sigma-54-dependent Fis family transcriptional regulator [Bacillota bacterium]